MKKFDMVALYLEFPRICFIDYIISIFGNKTRDFHIHVIARVSWLTVIRLYIVYYHMI
jgi:hypothetical protein